jgi:hypothetical protein
MYSPSVNLPFLGETLKKRGDTRATLTEKFNSHQRLSTFALARLVIEKEKTAWQDIKVGDDAVRKIVSMRELNTTTTTKSELAVHKRRLS